MKTIGLIGGMSWESTVTYYQVINKVIKEKLGGFHSAKCVLYSVDFAEIEKYQSNGDWEKSADTLRDASVALEKAGADFIIICTNTMHKIADDVQKKIRIPLLHIADLTAEVLLAEQIDKVALLGTKYTMKEDFYKSRLEAKGITVLIPDDGECSAVNEIIYNELCLGQIKDTSKKYMLELMKKLADKGAKGMILGCTEIGLLVNQSDTRIPLFDTALIHAEKAALYSLQS